MKKKSTLVWIFVAIFIGLFLVNYLMEIRDLSVDRKTDYTVFKSQLDTRVPNLMKKYGIPGTALAVIRQGTVDFVKGYGWADVNAKKAVDETTLFQMASNSKTLTVWAVMKLVEAGKLDLNAPVGQYVTRFKLPHTKYDNNGVTIRRILSHTAGLSQKSYAGYNPGDSGAGTGPQLPTLEQSLSGQGKGTRELKVIQLPGKKYKYSGGGYTLLQLMIEEVTGVSYSEYMASEVLKPLGMKNSSYGFEPQFQDRLAKGYGARGEELPNYLFTEAAAAGLYSNVSDMARFVVDNIEVFNGDGAAGSIIGPKSLALMYTPVDKDYGLGYIIKDLPDHTRLIYHGGSNRGWRTQFAVLPERGDGLVVLTNGEYGENLHRDLMAIWTQWETGFQPDFYLKNNLLRALLKTIALTLVLFLLLNLWSTIKNIRERKRRFITGQKFTAFVMPGLLLPVVLIALWWLVFYTGLISSGWQFAAFLPAGFTWITAAVVLWGVYLLGKGLFVKNESDKSVEAAGANARSLPTR